jgi:hypothetical protein
MMKIIDPYFKAWLLVSSILVSGITSVVAQTQIKKEVEVVKPYEPVVSDANKINTLPKINDSVVIKPVFQYNIVPTMITTEYQVTPINAAKMVSMPLTKLYNTYLKLGFGNYTTPMAEVYINSLRSKEYNAGLFFRHQSSAGNVTLANNKSVDAGYSNTSVALFGKKFLKTATIDADGGIDGNRVYDYGYNPKLDTSLDKGTIRQSYLSVKFNAGIQSSHSDSSKLNYHGGVGYNYFQDRFSHDENNVKLFGNFYQIIQHKLLGINTSFKLSTRNEALDSSRNSNSVLMLNPWIGFSSPEYRIEAGANLSFETQANSLTMHFYPKVEFQFVAIKEVMIPFVGITGQVNQHSYQDIATENPFIRPDLLVSNSNTTLSFYGGIKGSLGEKASYIVKADVSKINHQYFFVNDSTTRLQNQFTVVYDDVNLLSGYCEINYDYSDELSFVTKANLYQYSLTKEQYAWHKQPFDITFSTRYNMRNKILINLDVIGMSKRYAKEYNTTQRSKELPGVADFNLGIEYRYTKILSAWIHFNNLTASKFETWNQYPAQRFNMMLGFTYSL